MRKLLLLPIIFLLACFLIWHAQKKYSLQSLVKDTGFDLLEIELSNKDVYKTDQRVNPQRLSAQNPLKGRYVVAKAKYRNQVSPIEMRMRGSFEYHSFFARKSWRIKTPFHNPIFPETLRFNLARARFPHFEDHLVYELAKDLDMPAPLSKPVLFQLNGDWQGVYHVSEQMDEFFLQKLNLPYGPIFGEFRERSEKRKITSYVPITLGNLTMESPWTNGFTDIRQTLWQYLSLREEEKTGKADKLVEFLQTIHREQDDFLRKIDGILDMEKFQEWLGLQILAGSPHTNVHNIRLYYDPSDDKFRFLTWDLLPFRDYTSHRHMPVDWVPTGQELFLKLFLSPEFAELRNQRVWQLIQQDMPLPSLIGLTERLYEKLLAVYDKDSEKAFLGPYVAGNPALQNQVFSLDDFKQYHQSLKTWFKDRYQFLEDSLKIPSVNATAKKLGPSLRQVIVEHKWEAGLELDELILATDDKITGFDPAKIVLAFDADQNQKIDEGEALIPKNFYKDEKGFTHIAYETPPLFLAERHKVPYVQAARGLGIDMGDGHQTGLSGHLEQVEIVPTYFSFLILNKNRGVALPKTSMFLRNTVTAQRIEPKWVGLPPQENLKTWGADHRENMQAFFPSLYRQNLKPQSFVWQGEKFIDTDFFVSKGDRLTILPGTRVYFAPQTSLMVFGEITAKGTAEAPILLTAKEPQLGFGVIAVNGSSQPARFEHVTIEYGNEARIRHIPYSGALSVYNGDLILQNSTIRHNLGEDAVNVKYGGLNIDHSTFLNNHDGVDADFARGVISHNTFSQHRNDAIDLGSATLDVHDNHIESSADKGISVGGDSLIDLRDTEIRDCTLGLGVKDSSRVIMATTEIMNNETGIALYVKNRDFKLYTPGLKMLSGTIKDNKLDLWREERTSFWQTGGQIGR